MNETAPAKLTVVVPALIGGALPISLRDLNMRLLGNAFTDEPLQLAPGGYLLQLDAPDGVTYNAITQLEAGEDKTIEIPIGDAPGLAARWEKQLAVEQRLRKPVIQSFGPDTTAFPDNMPVGGGILWETTGGSGAPRPIWLARLWTIGDDGWRAVEDFPKIKLLDSATTADISRAKAEIRAFSTGMLYAELKSHANPPVLVALPMARGSAIDSCQLEIIDDGETLKASATLLQSERARLISEYLQNSAVEQAAGLLADAEELLYGKLQNPLEAALGGYALLRLDALPKLHTWPRNLADWIDWLPDGAIIHAEQMARQGDHPSAIEYLLKAGRRGLPMFNEGMDLLVGRLRDYVLYRRDNSAAQQHHDALQALLKRLSPWSSAMNPEPLTLVIEGRSPQDYGAPDADWTPISLTEEDTHND